MIILLLGTKSALASQTLHCEGRDRLAHLDVEIDNDYAIKINLTNATFPLGVAGHYTGTFAKQSSELRGTGTIADLSAGQSQILIAGNGKSFGVGLWADGDRRIESGFGVWFICQSVSVQQTVSANLEATKSFSISGNSVVHHIRSVGHLDLATFKYASGDERCGIYNDSPNALVIQQGQKLKLNAVLASGFIVFEILNLSLQPPSQAELYITQPRVGPLDHLTAESVLSQLDQCATQSGILQVD